MTITTYDPRDDLATTTDTKPLPDWVALLAPSRELAEVLAGTEFVPTSLRGHPAAITACILYGYEIGIGPMQSLRSIDVIQGRPTPSAELLRAMIYAAGHEMWVVEATGTRVVVAGRRAGSNREVAVTWTSEMARAAGLNTKETWRKFPRQMLFARATSELARVLFPDAIRGLGNLDDTADVPVVDMAEVKADTTTATTARRPRRRTIEAAPSAVASDAPTPSEPPEPSPRPGDDNAAAGGVPEGTTRGVTSDQLARMNIAFRELGVEDADQRRSIASAIIRRKLASATDMDMAEGSAVITALDDAQSLGLPLPTWVEDPPS